MTEEAQTPTPAATTPSMAVTSYVAHYVVKTENGFRVHNDVTFEELESPEIVAGPEPFKETYQALYRLRAEAAGVTAFCTRCGHFESHNSWCRVPSEEAKAAAAAA